MEDGRRVNGKEARLGDGSQELGSTPRSQGGLEDGRQGGMRYGDMEDWRQVFRDSDREAATWTERTSRLLSCSHAEAPS